MVKNPLANTGDPGCNKHRRLAFDPWEEEPGGLQSTGHQDSDMTEHTHTHTHTSANSESFTSSFLFWMLFYFFLFPNCSG